MRVLLSIIDLVNFYFNMNDFFEGSVVFLTDGDAEEFEIPAHRRITHPKAISAWRSSRTALKKAFRALGITIQESDLGSSGIQQLNSFPEWRFSITHSEKYSAAWVTRNANFGIGIDLESISRVISPELSLKIANASDTLPPDIRCWSLKEAIYKCYCGDEKQSKLNFSRISLVNGSFHIDGGESAGIYFQEMKVNGIVFSLAKSFNRTL